MKRIQDCLITDVLWLNETSYILELVAPDNLPRVFPGQFAEIRIDNSREVFLRRPFSFLDIDYEHKKIRFLIKMIGKGTKRLGELKAGMSVNIIYPLGNHFSLPEHGHALIVGGGSGIAPFILLGKELRRKGIAMTFLLGGKQAGDILLADTFCQFGEVLVTTEDGLLGSEGLITQHPIFGKDDFNFSMVYACGPEPMMKAVAAIAAKKNVPCEVSLENLMACGFGVCLCCVVETAKGNQCVCTEGPVFNVNNLKWQT
ncbi:MAG TPA: dihydroorotate dehydrogenase electron transfer subunit [Bacteroidales bacterium]|nr:dihydroorotate dehydrogenase electron transfer subunit [Bacteroidales bacterium]HNS47006.1 dihydroorotate dehydrogenase electron transfer subunit [Bacteroidales bacterium]